MKNGNEKTIYDREIFGFGCRDYELVIRDFFPWADIDIDKEFYEDNMDCEMEYNDLSSGIYPYANGAGEVDYYRLKLTLNQIGQSFIELDRFLETGRFYYLGYLSD